MKNHFIFLGAILALLSVMLGAFGAHGLKQHIAPHLMEVYQTGVQYHMLHALGLILLGIVVEIQGARRLYSWAGNCMLVGIVLFSGSLYLLAITGIRWLGAITPLGGILFLLAWALFALGTRQTRRA